VAEWQTRGPQVPVGATPWRFESSQPHPFATLSDWFLPLSSRGLGRRPLTAETGVRIPVAVPLRPARRGGFRRSSGLRRIGDSLRRKIDAGIARTRFGVVVLSHAFFAKNWSQYELDGLVVREMIGGKQIIRRSGTTSRRTRSSLAARRSRTRWHCRRRPQPSTRLPSRSPRWCWTRRTSGRRSAEPVSQRDSRPPGGPGAD
jgi:hypothetical protein